MFSIDEKFIDSYKCKQPPFGFDGFGEIVYLRTYSRIKENGDNEVWWETIRRVVEGTFNLQREWLEQHRLGWNYDKAQISAQEMYDRIFHMKFLPPGRGLWAMGSPIINERKLYAALNNCAFVSTQSIDVDYAEPFEFLMDMSMLGVGVGFDTKGAGKIIIRRPGPEITRFTIPDSREGWVKSVKDLINSYFLGLNRMEFDYSEIRAEALPIKGFGGLSSGPGPLVELHENIRQTLDQCIDAPITLTCIVDIQNYIGKCVVAGNVRRTAEIAFGEANEEYLNLKNYEINPHRAAYGWASNNSVFATLGMDYGEIVERIKANGEPGLAWLENMRGYSRMADPQDNKDYRVSGGNPCLEQSLESFELCCLVETFPDNHDSIEDFLLTLKYAYLYAKTVTLGKTHWIKTNQVMLRNRRIGCSMSGIAQFITNRGLDVLRQWCVRGYEKLKYYDSVYSDWYAIPRSIKMTSIKPSGTVSLLAGATPGIHFPESEYYIRRMRLSIHSKLIEPLRQAGYVIEPCIGSEDSTLVVEFPVHVRAKKNIRTVRDLSMWEQLEIAAFMQHYWADNQVSATITFNKAEADQIEHALSHFQYRLKGVSFLPIFEDYGSFPQMPYEKISEETYIRRTEFLRIPNFNGVANEDVEIDRFCNNDVCTL